MIGIPLSISIAALPYVLCTYDMTVLMTSYGTYYVTSGSHNLLILDKYLLQILISTYW